MKTKPKKAGKAACYKNLLNGACACGFCSNFQPKEELCTYCGGQNGEHGSSNGVRCPKEEVKYPCVDCGAGYTQARCTCGAMKYPHQAHEDLIKEAVKRGVKEYAETFRRLGEDKEDECICIDCKPPRLLKGKEREKVIAEVVSIIRENKKLEDKQPSSWEEEFMRHIYNYNSGRYSSNPIVDGSPIASIDSKMVSKLKVLISKLLKEAEEKALIKGQIEALKNVKAWTEQMRFGDELAIKAHTAAIETLEAELEDKFGKKELLK